MIFTVCVKAFGAPTMLLHDSNNKKHMVFGSDRMHIVAMLLSKLFSLIMVNPS